MDNDRPDLPGPASPGNVKLGRRAHAWVGGSGEPFLLLHGWGLRPHIFMPALRHLAAKGFHVAAPTLAVVGRRWSVESAAQRALHTMDHLGWERAVVLGYSLGGAIATALSATHPHRVRLLALVNSVGSPIERGPLGWALPFTRYARAQNVKALRAFGRNAFTAGGLANLADAARYARGAALAEELAAVRDAGVEAVVLWSSRDRLLPAEGGRKIADVLDAPFHVVPNADHDWPMRQPELFARELDLLLRSALAVGPRRISGRRPRRAARSDRP